MSISDFASVIIVSVALAFFSYHLFDFLLDLLVTRRKKTLPYFPLEIVGIEVEGKTFTALVLTRKLQPDMSSDEAEKLLFKHGLVAVSRVCTIFGHRFHLNFERKVYKDIYGVEPKDLGAP